MKDLSIRNKLHAGSAAIVAIISVLLLLPYDNFARLSDASERDRHWTGPCQRAMVANA